MRPPWPRAKLGEVCEILRGGSPRPIKNFLTTKPDGLNWIKIGDVDPDGKYITHTADKITRDGLGKTRQVSAGDFVLSNSMSFGRPYILRIDGCIHDGWLVLKGFQKYWSEDYFYYLLRSDCVQSQFENLAHGSTVRNLNTEAVSQVIVGIPPLSVQREIVARLERELGAVDELAKKFDELEQTAEAEFKAELAEEMGRLGRLGQLGRAAAVAEVAVADVPGVADVPLTPTRWAKLGEICEKIGSGATPLGGKKTYCEDGVGLIRSQNVLDLSFSFGGLAHINDDQANRLDGVTVCPQDVLLNITGDSVARACVVDEKVLPARVNQHVAIIRVANKEELLPHYLELWFVASKPILLDESQKGSTRKALTKEYIANLVIPLPPLPAQRAIVARLDAAKARKEALVSAAKRGREAAALWRKAILKEAFDG